MELHTPKRESRPSAESLDGSPSMCDTTLYPWNWGEEARNVNLSPGSSCSSPEYREQHVAVLDAGGGSASGRSAAGNASESHRRGRPRADALTNLMKQGSTSPSSIKCTYCNRVFPREKSLQAHLRTHTGKRGFLPRRQRRKPVRLYSILAILVRGNAIGDGSTCTRVACAPPLVIRSLARPANRPSCRALNT